MAEIDELPRALPATPHELHAYGPMSPATAAAIIGGGRTQIHERIASGDLPTTVIFGNVRIEPLVAWAARQGATKKTLLDVVDALQRGKGVDDIIVLVREGIRAQPPPVKKPRGANKKKAQAGGGA